MFGADDQIGQEMDQLNQWLSTQKPPADWQVDPLVAPLAKSLASFVEYVKPVDAALSGPRNVLELKDIVRHFVAPAARLEKLAQKQSLAQLDQLARQYADSLKQIDDIARKAGDYLREARESGRDPASVKARSGAGASDVEEELRHYETARFGREFNRRVTNPAKQATFNQLCDIARQLDYSGRLREPRSLAALAQALEEFAAKHDRKEAETLVGQYEEVVSLVSRDAEGWTKTRLSAELRFILDEFNNAGRMKDLAEWKTLEQGVGEVAERLKIAARRTGRVELRELALQVDDARNRRDTAALKTAAAKLADLVRPGSSDDLKDSARQLADRAKLLVQLGEQMGRLAAQRQSEALQDLAKYAAELAEKVQTAAKLLENPPPAADPQRSDAYLDQFTTQYAVLGARVSRLAEDLDYFATLGALHFPAADWRRGARGHPRKRRFPLGPGRGGR